MTSLILENSIQFTSQHPVFTTYSVLLNFITTSITPMLQIIYRRDVCNISWVLQMVARLSSCTITADIHPREYPHHIINDPQVLSFSVMNACVSRRLRMTTISRHGHPVSLAYRYQTTASIDKVLARLVHCFTSDCLGSIMVGRAEEMNTATHERFNDELYSIFELPHTSTETNIYNELITPRTTEVEFCMQHALNYNHHLVTNIWSKLGTLALDLSVQVFETSMSSTFAPTELYMQTDHPHIVLIRHTQEQVYTMVCVFPSITECARYETALANIFPCK
jgi:hypothetical protein